MIVALLFVLCAESVHWVLAGDTFNSTQNSLTAASSELALSVCLVVEEDSYFTTYDRFAPAVDLAVMHVNSYILPENVKLEVIYQNAGPSCTKTQFSVTSNVMRSIRTGTTCNVFLGAGCSSTAAALYGMADDLNIPLFGCPAAGVSALALDPNNDSLSLLLRPAFGFRDLADFLLEVFRVNNYTDITIFRDDTYSLFNLLSLTILQNFREKNEVVFDNAQEVAFFSKASTEESYQRMLKDANDHSRVIIIFSHSSVVRTIMLVASKLGYVQGNHVYFALELYDLEYWGKIDYRIGDKSDAIAKEAFRSLLVIAFHENRRSYMYEFEDRLKLLARKNYNYSFNLLEKVDLVILSYYESIVVYAEEVTSMLREELPITNGTLMCERVRRTKYESPLGTITISEDGVRDKFYEIRILQPQREQFEVALWSEPFNDTAITFRVIENFSFPNNHPGKLPPNEPFCGFRDDRCKELRLAKQVLTTAVVVPLLLIAGLTATATFIFVKLRKMRHDFNPNWWKIITEEELTIKQNRASSGSKRTLKSLSTAGTSAMTGYSSYVCDILATYKGVLVALTDVAPQKIHITPDIIAKLTLLKGVTHANLQRFIGIGLDSTGTCEYVVAELCSKGSLTDILDNEMIKLDWSFKNSLIKDVVLGMAHIHGSPLVSHGNLNSHACLIDTRFQLKISDYGLPFFRKVSDLQPAKPAGDPPERNYETLLWRAPELLRQLMPPEGTQKGDVYSFAILLQQIILRSMPFELPNDPLELSEREIIHEVISANIPPVRPRVPRATCSNELYDLMERCWEEIPLERPTFPKIKERLRKVIGEVGDNIVDLLFKRMEQYAADLEFKVAEKTQQFMDEKNRSEQLLSQLLPKPVAAALTRGEHIDPEAYESVSIFFSDIVGFTVISAFGTPMDVINLLNGLYTFFDGILAKYDVYKVETIGDAYMVSSGLPVRNGNRHAAEIAGMSLEIIKAIRTFPVPNRPQEVIRIRIGINSGPCVAGIIGISMPRYCLFGDTVNVASRMESTGEPMKIQLTKSTKDLLREIGGFRTTERGETVVKGKGMLLTYWLLE